MSIKYWGFKFKTTFEFGRKTESNINCNKAHLYQYNVNGKVNTWFELDI